VSVPESNRKQQKEQKTHQKKLGEIKKTQFERIGSQKAIIKAYDEDPLQNYIRTL
jgi:hypothetical protein